MARVVDYLQADRKSGILSYRRKFPTELVAFIPSASPKGRGRVEMKVSLRSPDINAPGTLDRYLAVERDYVAVVERAQKLASGSYDRIEAPLIQYLATTYVHNQLALDEAGRWGRPGPDFNYASRPAPEDDYIECRELLAGYDSAGLVTFWQDWVCDYARALGYVVNPSDPNFASLCQAMGEAACTLWLALDKRIDDTPVETPLPADKPEVSKPSSSPVASITLQAAADEIMASKIEPVKHSTVSQWNSALRFFREAHGTPSTSTVTRQMVTEWLELLAQRPSKLPASECGLPLRDVAALYAGVEGVPRLVKKTLRVHLASLATIWNKGQERGLIEDGIANPFKARRSLASGQDEEEGTEFDMDELQAMFDLPVFTARDRPKQGGGEACYWMPLLLLWTGVRPEEAAQLMVADFFHSDDTGEWMMMITDEGEHPVKGPRNLKSSRRVFPVPGQLLALGLVEYLQYLKAAGELALFPKLTIKSRTKMYLSSLIGEWWSKYIREHEVVLKRKDGKNRRPSRDFRPTWATAARHARVPEEAMSYLMGHSNKGAVTTRRYGGKHPHASYMNEVAFPKLDFSGVLPWKPD